MYLYHVEKTVIRPQEAYPAISMQALQASLHRIRRGEKLFHYTWFALLLKSIVADAV